MNADGRMSDNEIGTHCTLDPLWKVQRRALVDDLAARECARRYVDLHIGYAERDGQYAKRLHSAYLAGLRGEPDKYKAGAGGNFSRPLSRAHQCGAELRSLLKADLVQRQLIGGAS